MNFPPLYHRSLSPKRNHYVVTHWITSTVGILLVQSYKRVVFLLVLFVLFFNWLISNNVLSSLMNWTDWKTINPDLILLQCTCLTVCYMLC